MKYYVIFMHLTIHYTLIFKREVHVRACHTIAY